MAGYYEKTKSGKYRLFVSAGTGPGGKRKRLTKTVEAKSDREAEKLLAQFVAEVEKGQYIEPGKLTFAEFVNRWLRDYGEVKLEPKTLHRYKEILGRVLEAMGHLRIDQIRPLHLVEFYQNLREEGIRKDGREGRLSEDTVLYHHKVISSIFNKAVKWGVVAVNPASKVDPPKSEGNQPAVYDEKQTAALLAALDEEPLKYKVIVILALATGLRRGELMGLEWPDVDFENNTITVNKASQYLPKKGTFTKGPKTKSSNRKIAVPESVMTLLK